MGLFGYKLFRHDDVNALKQQLNDLKLVVESQRQQSSQIQEAIKERRRTLNRPLQYRTPAVGSDHRKDTGYTYYGPGYDLAEIGRAIDIEPYINQSVRKHREQILKEGFRLKGEDPEMVDYCNNRLFEISLISGITTQQMVREFTTNLVAYGTAFLVVRRDAERSSGRTIRMHGKDREPIAALYPLDPTSVSVALNDYGHPVRWKQRVPNAVGNQTEITFDADDVIVATIDKKPGFVFGTPYILPTLDDVRSLRRLEEIAEVIGQRHAFPLLHFKVGLDEIGPQVFDDGTSEVDLVKSLVDNMSSQGGLVTSNRVEGVLLGGDKQTLDIEPYLQYFEKRVLGGLRLSEVDLGRGETASKASAVTVSQGLQDSARDFQAVIADVFNNYLFLPLCLEGGFDVKPTENMVTLDFTMIDREEERAKQSHGSDLYMNGAITHAELRKEYLGKNECSEDEKCDLYQEKEHERQKELTKMTGEQAIQKAKVTKSQSAKNKTANKNRPRNQHGRKAAKTKVTKNSMDLAKDGYSVIQESCMYETRDIFLDWVEKHQGGVVCEDDDPMDATTKADELTLIFNNWVTAATEHARVTLAPIIDIGAKDCLTDMSVSGMPSITKKAEDRFYKNSIEKSFKVLADAAIGLTNSNDALSGLTSDTPLSTVASSIIDQLQGELKSLSFKQIDLAYRFGYAKTARAHGYTTVIMSPDGWHCDDCQETGDIEVSLIDKNGAYRSILSTHGTCEFGIRLGEK